ncbi:MAG: hypothetical protein M1818_004707 [Claussenomyces sp. TS43310]|nr:MAG: hypothetical protein M1818_004707 [Claussenomyces sp. TS43310]
MSLGPKHRGERDENAIEDDDNDDLDDSESTFSKTRLRRASEGQPIKSDGKRPPSNDLKCTQWEHTPEWSYTSKLLISKHQQVQLLEAASVLVAMNSTDAPTPPDSARDFHSDQDSASPAASGSSDQLDGLSSADTTPPPQTDAQTSYSYSGSSYGTRVKRYSNGNTYSRSYQSGPFSNSQVGDGSAPNGFGFSHYHQQSSERRPLSSGLTIEGQEDEAGLAAAVELLSCSFGTPRTGPVTLPPDIPPVPPLPAQYLSQGALSGQSFNPIRQVQPVSKSYMREEKGHHPRDVEMEDESVMDDEDFDIRSRDRSDEDDDGVFGRMEE